MFLSYQLLLLDARDKGHVLVILLGDTIGLDEVPGGPGAFQRRHANGVRYEPVFQVW